MPDNITTADPVATIAERALSKTAIVQLTGWSTTTNRYLFVAPYDCNIQAVSIVSDTAVAASDTNYYSHQIQNLTQAEALLSAAQTTKITGGAAIAVDAPYAITPDQNSIVSNGDVIELQVTATGTPTDISAAQLVAVVEYV
ncbi:MAG: hypothetical protein HQ478_04670 [Chloroflexi bacterium]|nr:hypothetical protein [Chloroflexota bacterium]